MKHNWLHGISILLSPDDKDSAGASDRGTKADSSAESDKDENKETVQSVAQKVFAAAVKAEDSSSSDNDDGNDSDEDSADGKSADGKDLSSKSTDGDNSEDSEDSSDTDEGKDGNDGSDDSSDDKDGKDGKGETGEGEDKDENENENENEGESDSESDDEDEDEDGDKNKSESDDKDLNKPPVKYSRFYEVNEKAKALEASNRQLKPLADSHQSLIDFCEENDISETQFQEGLVFMKLLNTDPIEARKALEPVWSKLNALSGEALPEDLQKEVDDGEISLKRAKEIAELRGRTEIKKAQAKLDAARQERTSKQAWERELQKAISAWTQNKMTSDTGFKPKTSANAADGKFEFVSDRYLKLLNEGSPKTVADAMKLLERAYTEVSRAFKPAPKQNSEKKTVHISSTKSSNNSNKKPTLKSVVDAVVQKHSSGS